MGPFWFKASWRVIVLSLVIGILLKLPANFIITIAERISDKVPVISLIMVLLLLLIVLPVYTFLFTRLVSILWRPSDLYDRLQLTADYEQKPQPNTTSDGDE